ncbi:MAG TPA: dihydropteroate synthase [Steroidobacteraceae bacterium]|jgi:dihydropteroate synthase|nr:dihydropteroate synthase [Steroidobacteraceae bacterium]
MIIDCGSRELDLSAPVVMGVLNVTPDSFSDGGKYIDPQRAVDHAKQMIEQGARIIDIGGESTRPGAVLVSVEEELRRTIPVIEQVSKFADVLVSIDTSKPEVMRQAVAAGARIINDIRALTEPEALRAAASTGAAVCVMHMQGQPDNMQTAPQYTNVVAEVHRYLAERIAACAQAGISRSKIMIDPGIGFGKTLQHNLELLSHLPTFSDLSCPLLIGVSRKSMIGKLLDRTVDERISGGVALATAAMLAGAKIIRTHDVSETVDAVRVATSLLERGYTCGNDI